MTVAPLNVMQEAAAARPGAMDNAAPSSSRNDALKWLKRCQLGVLGILLVGYQFVAMHSAVGTLPTGTLSVDADGYDGGSFYSSFFAATSIASAALTTKERVQLGRNLVGGALSSLTNAINDDEEEEPEEEERQSKARTEKKKPLNILVLYPDDWRHDSIGGVQPVVRTPFLNKLASDGIRFTHNAVTTSICWISRATYFTGQYVSRHGSTYLFRPKFTEQENWKKSWPAMLQTLGGYYVGHVGKWQYRDVGGFLSEAFNWSRFHEGWHWQTVDKEGHRIHAADKARDDAIKFLRRRPKDKPFALTVAFYPPKAVGSSYEPGAQWSPKNKSREMYEDEVIPEPYNMTEAYNSLPYFFFKSEKENGRFRFKQRFASHTQYQEGMKNYYALITDVDKACKQVVEELKKQGVYDETLIIFTTDNGLFHGEHGLAGKWYPYQESIRVPLIIYDPRMPKDKRGTLDDSFTLNIDLAETILGAAGINPDPLMQGRDISDLYMPKQNDDQEGTKDEEAWRNEFYYEFPIGEDNMPSSTALVRKKWKYIHWSDYNFEQLFNLESDPLEMEDLWGRPDHDKVLRNMRKRHDELRFKVMEPCKPNSKCDPLQKPGT